MTYYIMHYYIDLRLYVVTETAEISDFPPQLRVLYSHLNRLCFDHVTILVNLFSV